MNLQSFYFSFEPTGDREIDLILSAVANAGKYFHSTELWPTEAPYKSDDDLKGRTPIDWIQNAARDAAFTMPYHADVGAERRRQVEVEGFDAKHDDATAPDKLALAAAVYAIPDHYRYLSCEGFGTETGSIRKVLWPWDDAWFKPGDRRRELVKAAALIIAEIEAIDRANAS